MVTISYIINGDASGLTDEEIRMVDEAMRKNNIEMVSPRYNEDMCTNLTSAIIRSSDCLQKLRTATSSITSNNPFNNIRYERYRIFQENHTSLFWRSVLWRTRLFAAKYDNPDKNIDDCVTYILNWVQKSGCNGFCDDEIYGQAIHYYEEKDIEVGKPLNCQVSVNHQSNSQRRRRHRQDRKPSANISKSR